MRKIALEVALTILWLWVSSALLVNDGYSVHSVDGYIIFILAESSYRNGDLRLVGGPHNWEGRVEVYWNGTWGTISDLQWSTADAEVVCKQLKYSTGTGITPQYSAPVQKFMF